MFSARSLLAAFLLGLMATAAHAAQVTYTFTGVASGEMGGVAFSGEQMTVTFQADPANVASFMPGGFFVLPNTSAVTIGGGAAHAFVDDPYVFNVQDPNNGVIGFGTDQSGDLVDLDVGGLPSYDLTTSLGPIGGIASAGILGQFVNVPLSGAVSLTLTSLTDATFAAVVVPEPGSLALAGLAVGLSLVTARSRRLGAQRTRRHRDREG
jgi:hypothetical protein